MPMKRIAELESLARTMVGDGSKPNLFFVTREGTVVTVTRSFDVAYAEWRKLPRTIETGVEDRLNGTICSTSPDSEGSTRLVTHDDSHWMLKNGGQR